jgi:hypothetical protein
MSQPSIPAIIHCIAFTKTGNPCRNRKKIGREYCGKHDPEGKQSEGKQSVPDNNALLNANSVEEKKVEEKKVVNPEDDYHGHRCTKITQKGTRCKHFMVPGRNGLCTRHHLNDVIAQQAHPRQPLPPRVPSAQAVRNQTYSVRDISDHDAEMEHMIGAIFGLSFNHYEYKQPIVQPRAGAGAMGYKMNMKTLRECECDICAEDKKRMIMLHCCRKEMCGDCMLRITNAKCPFCKQANNMLID